MGVVATKLSQTNLRWSRSNRSPGALVGFLLLLLIGWLSVSAVALAEEKLGESVTEGVIKLVNPGFDEPVQGNEVPGWKSGWRYPDGKPLLSRTFFTLSDEVVQSGRFSLKMDGTSTDGVELVATSAPVPAIPGYTYTGSVSFYHPTVKDPRPYVLVAFFNEEGRRINHSQIVRSGAVEGRWDRVSSSGVAPEGTVTASFIIIGNTNFTGVTYWDDAMLEVSAP